MPILRATVQCLVATATVCAVAVPAVASEETRPQGTPVILFEDANRGPARLAIDEISSGWGTVRIAQAPQYGPRADLAGDADRTSITYFTPRLSGLGGVAQWSSASVTASDELLTTGASRSSVSLGLSYDEVLGSVSIRAGMVGVVGRSGEPSRMAQVTAGGFGPRADWAERDWRASTVLGYRNVELGARLGEGGTGRCGLWDSCAGDTLDIGLAYRFDAGSVAAGYTASTGALSLDARSIYSLSADYSVAPRMDLYGGVNWVDIDASAGRDNPGSGAVFLLGTNVRF